MLIYKQELKKLAPEHINVARIYSNLGAVQRDVGDLQQAEEHYMINAWTRAYWRRSY